MNLFCWRVNIKSSKSQCHSPWAQSPQSPWSSCRRASTPRWLIVWKISERRSKRKESTSASWTHNAGARAAIVGVRWGATAVGTDKSEQNERRGWAKSQTAKEKKKKKITPKKGRRKQISAARSKRRRSKSYRKKQVSEEQILPKHQTSVHLMHKSHSQQLPVMSQMRVALTSSQSQWRKEDPTRLSQDTAREED